VFVSMKHCFFSLRSYKLDYIHKILKHFLHTHIILNSIDVVLLLMYQISFNQHMSFSVYVIWLKVFLFVL